MIYELSLLDVITFEDSNSVLPNYETLTHQLSFTGTVRHNIRTRKPKHNITFAQVIAWHKGVNMLSVTHNLYFTQSAKKEALTESIVSGLSLWQLIKQPLWEQVSSTLVLTDDLLGEASVGFSSDIEFDPVINVNMVWSRTIESDLDLDGGVVGYLCDPEFNQLNPTIITIDKVKFIYLGSEREFHKPDFGDKYSSDFTRINRRSRGGDLLISRASFWPAVQNLQLSFSYLTQADIDWLLWFFKASLGKQCQYLNYDNVLWQGFITNPQAQARQLGRCNFAIDIEFDGVPV